MAKINRKAGSTDQTIRIKATHSTTGAPLTALAYNTASLKIYYQRTLAAPVEITLVTQTVTGAHTDGGFVEIDSTKTPGHYRLDLPDAACAAGVDSVSVCWLGATNLLQGELEIDLLNDSNIASLNAAVIDNSHLVDPIYADIKSMDDGVITAIKVAADAIAKIQNGLATPTNITAGTITTTTNLTNLPTMPANWITALGLKSDALAAIAAAWASTDISTAAALHNDTIASLLIDAGRYAQGDPVETSLATTARAELAARPAANAPIVDKLTWLVMFLLNKLEQTATTKTLYADNGSTPVATSGATDDGTTFTSGEWA